MCCPTLSQEMGKQKHLVDSFHDFHRKGSEVGGTTCREQQCWEARCVSPGEASLQVAEVLPHGKGSEWPSVASQSELTSVDESSK